jgi:predicted transcriptional regulator
MSRKGGAGTVLSVRVSPDLKARMSELAARRGFVNPNGTPNVSMLARNAFEAGLAAMGKQQQEKRAGQ